MNERTCTVEGCEKTCKSRLYCPMHAERLRKTGELGGPAPTRVRTPGNICRVEGCAKAKARNHGLCSMHQARHNRTGSLELRGPRDRYVADHGYVRTYAPEHPLADTTGYVYEHRAVLYAAIGDGPTTCAWCRCDIEWKPQAGSARLEVDHFNADREDNHPANLLPSCRACNVGRIDPYEFHRNGTPRKRAA